MSKVKANLTHEIDEAALAQAQVYQIDFDSKGLPKNKFNLFEFAGSFGDLGVLIPFVVAYITIVGLNPQGVLFGFGISLLFVGLYYRTPVPVQPMKAIGGAVIAQPSLGAGAVYGAGIVTGLFWLIASRFKAIQKIRNFVSKPVLRGIMFGLGFVFVSQGLGYMQDNLVLAAIGVVIILGFLASKKIPAMLVLLLVGAIAALILQPSLLGDLSAIRPHFELPTIVLPQITPQDLLVGAIFLALPQIPLTLGNAVIALVEENNNLFPYRKITETQVAGTKGLMNIVSSVFGGVPLCHGAGGMAAHVRYGAHTGGAIIFLGTIFLVLAFFFSDSILVLTELFPKAMLGVILMFAGIELAMSAKDIPREKSQFYLFLITAAFSMFNIALGFILGLVLQVLIDKNILHI